MDKYMNDWIDNASLEFEKQYRKERESYWWASCPTWMGDIILKSQETMDVNVPGNTGKAFRMHFSNNYFNKNDIIMTDRGITLKVLQKPYKKWYRKLMQFITFGLYKAPYGYKVKIQNDE